MNEWKEYRRTGLSQMRPYVPGEDVSGISISAQDAEAGSPKEGDMIARNPDNDADQWLVAKAYFEKNLELAGDAAAEDVEHNCEVPTRVWLKRPDRLRINLDFIGVGYPYVDGDLALISQNGKQWTIAALSIGKKDGDTDLVGRKDIRLDVYQPFATAGNGTYRYYMETAPGTLPLRHYRISEREANLILAFFVDRPVGVVLDVLAILRD